MGHRGPLLRPRCTGHGRARTQIPLIHGTPLCFRRLGVRQIMRYLNKSSYRLHASKWRCLWYMKHNTGNKPFGLIPTEHYYLSCQRHSKNTSDRTKHSSSKEPLENSLWANDLSNLFSFLNGPSLHNKTHIFFTQSAAFCHPPPPLILVN
jgi:hypothetical protein